MAAALADHLGKIGLRIEEFVAKPLVAGRFLEWIEVGSLDVFDDRELERLPVVGLEDDNRHLMQSGALRRPPRRGILRRNSDAGCVDWGGEIRSEFSAGRESAWRRRATPGRRAGRQDRARAAAALLRRIYWVS